MPVIRTDKWLRDSFSEPLTFCERLEDYFDEGKAVDIYRHLTIHGMYQPTNDGVETVRKLEENDVWSIIEQEHRHLKKLWNGPDIPIFIFPAEKRNKRLKADFNGKSGLAFQDKCFLFVSENNEKKEILALFTHEYSHVTRLTKLAKTEGKLLDAVILEGLAENAVRERFGDKLLAGWTSYYSDEELAKFWKTLIQPNKDIKENHRKYFDLLYGLRFYPKMLGYCVGYYLVKKYLDENKYSTKEILAHSSEKIAKIQ